MHYNSHEENARIANTQDIARAVSRFEDVFGIESTYLNDTEDATSDLDEDEDYDSTLQGSPRPSIVGLPRNPRKRKAEDSGLVDGKKSNRKAKRATVHLDRSDDSNELQRLLDQSHLRADALRVNEFKVDLSLLNQCHSSLEISTKVSYDRYQLGGTV